MENKRINKSHQHGCKSNEEVYCVCNLRICVNIKVRLIKYINIHNIILLIYIYIRKIKREVRGWGLSRTPMVLAFG